MRILECEILSSQLDDTDTALRNYFDTDLEIAKYTIVFANKYPQFNVERRANIDSNDLLKLVHSYQYLTYLRALFIILDYGSQKG